MARPEGSTLPNLHFKVYEQTGGEFPLRFRGIVAAYDSDEAFAEAKKKLHVLHPVIERRHHVTHH